MLKWEVRGSHLGSLRLTLRPLGVSTAGAAAGTGTAGAAPAVLHSELTLAAKFDQAKGGEGSRRSSLGKHQVATAVVCFFLLRASLLLSLMTLTRPRSLPPLCCAVLSYTVFAHPRPPGGFVLHGVAPLPGGGQDQLMTITNRWTKTHVAS